MPARRPQRVKQPRLALLAVDEQIAGALVAVAFSHEPRQVQIRSRSRASRAPRLDRVSVFQRLPNRVDDDLAVRFHACCIVPYPGALRPSSEEIQQPCTRRAVMPRAGTAAIQKALPILNTGTFRATAVRPCMSRIPDEDLKAIISGPARRPIRCNTRRVAKQSSDVSELVRGHQRCQGTGWLCEEHSDRPFGHDGCAGPGVPCSCNPRGEAEWKSIDAGGDDRDHIADSE